LRFNTTTELMEYYDGNQWKPIDAPPTISSISTDDATGDDAVLAADGSTLYTVTITGGNFGIGANVKFIGNTGTEYTAGSINRVSNSSITCTTTAEMGTTDDPYDVQVANVSGLAATLEDAFSFNAPPEFDNASGSLGSAFNTLEVTGSTLDASATDAEGDTITYSIASGSLPSGLTIGSSTGLITGTPSGNTAGVFNFVVQAATAEGNSTRDFSIEIKDLPTGGSITTSGNFRIHTFNSSSSFVVPSGLTISNVEYLVIAGGGGAAAEHGTNGAGGGGAGGYRTSVVGATSGGGASAESRLTLTAATYTVTIGGGGPGITSGAGAGTAGVNSTFGSSPAITSTGGGRGANSTAGTGGSGGSGGGGETTASTPGGAGTAGQGFAGGTATVPNGGGGGGGAGQTGRNGGDPAGGRGGVGGAGVSSSITGSAVTRGGGGGGAGWENGAGSPGGTGGGGISSTRDSGNVGANGVANTGGGGGAAKDTTSYGGQSGAGGSGVVIIRYDLTTL
jgi:hypothetical protein